MSQFPTDHVRRPPFAHTARRLVAGALIAMLAIVLLPSDPARAATPTISFAFDGFAPLTNAANALVRITPAVDDNGAVASDRKLQFLATWTHDNHAQPNFHYRPGAGDTRTREAWSFTPDATTGEALFPSTPFTLADVPELVGTGGLPLDYQVGFNDGSYTLALQLVDVTAGGDPQPLGDPASVGFTVDDYDGCTTSWIDDNDRTDEDDFLHAANWTAGVPGNADQACMFDGGGSGGTIVFNTDQTVTVHSLYVGTSDTDGTTLKVVGGGSLKVANFVYAGDTVFDVAGANFEVAGHVELGSVKVGPNGVAALGDHRYVNYWVDERGDLGGVTLDGGTLRTGGPLRVWGLTWNAGTVSGDGIVEVNSGGHLNGTGPMVIDGATFQTASRVQWIGGDLTVSGGGTIHTLSGTLEVDGDFDVLAGSGSGRILNDYDLYKDEGVGTSRIEVPVHNGAGGTIIVDSGVVDLAGGVVLSEDGALDGDIRLQQDATLALTAPSQSPITRVTGDVNLSQTGSRIVDANGNDALRHLSQISGDAKLMLRRGYHLALAGDLLVAGRLSLPPNAKLSTPGRITVEGGDNFAMITVVDAAIEADAITVGTQGCLWGAGTVTADVTAGCIGADPESYGSVLAITGDLTLTANPDGGAWFGVDGTQPGKFGQITVSGSATLDGVIGAYEYHDWPSPLQEGDRVPLITAATMEGGFDSVDWLPTTTPPAEIRVDTDTARVLLVVPDLTPPTWADDASLTASNVTATGAHLSWTEAGDNVGVDHYFISGGPGEVEVAGTASSTVIGGLTAGTTYTLHITAVDADGNATAGPTVTVTPTAPASGGGDPSPSPVESSASTTTTVPGQRVSTLPPGGSVSEDRPLATGVVAPVPGEVSITQREASFDQDPDGVARLNLAVDITAPPADSPDNPLVLDFTFHPSAVPDGVDATNLVVERNGVAVARCEDPDPQVRVAVPDPCAKVPADEDGNLVVDEDGNLVVTVFTTRASTWTFAGRVDAASACPAGRVPSAGFGDVAAGSTHAAAVDCVVWWGLANGFDADTFGPDVTVTRAQMAAFVARLVRTAGGDLPEGARRFVDVAAGSTHAGDIHALAAAGIVNGTGAVVFEPQAEVSRGQMAALLVRAYGYVAGEQPQAARDWFVDDDGTTHEAAVNVAADLGFTSGVTGTTFEPWVAVRRDQTASFLANTLERLTADGQVAGR